MECKICGYINEDKKGFATHLQNKHQLKSRDYTIKYLNGGNPGICPICGEETRYVSFTFKKYCKSHSNYAERAGGKKGGQAEAWNKGLTKENDERIKKQAENMMGENNHFYGKKHPKNLLEKLRKQRFLTKEEFVKRLETRSEDFIFDVKYEDYKSRQYYFFNVKCKKCGFVEEKTLSYLERGSRCSKCYPLNISSKPEQEIVDYLVSIGITGIVKNTRNIIAPKELDIYIPTHNLAIEYNGLYWHTEDKVGKKLHYEKTKMCLEKNIALFHIFSDEWENKRDIVKSMISHRLKLQKNRIYARKCVIREVANKNAMNFFDRTHISGPGGAFCKCFGAFHENKMVSCLALKKPFERKENKEINTTIENARFSTELDTIVVGGFSKLLKEAKRWSVEQGFKEMKSFADLRFGVGEVYEKCGFLKTGTTPENYWYTDCRQRFFRTLIRAQPGKPERQVAEENEVQRIYGCGSNIYKLTLS